LIRDALHTQSGQRIADCEADCRSSRTSASRLRRKSKVTRPRESELVSVRWPVFGDSASRSWFSNANGALFELPLGIQNESRKAAEHQAVRPCESPKPLPGRVSQGNFLRTKSVSNFATLLCCSISFRVTGSGFLAVANFQRLLKTTETQVDVFQKTVVETRGDAWAGFLAPAAGCGILPGSQSDVHRETSLSQAMA